MQMVQLSAIKCICIAISWVSLVSFASITLCVASQWVFIVVGVYFVIDSVRKLLDTPSHLIWTRHRHINNREYTDASWVSTFAFCLWRPLLAKYSECGSWHRVLQCNTVYKTTKLCRYDSQSHEEWSTVNSVNVVHIKYTSVDNI
jgi:hypothetical protein